MKSVEDDTTVRLAEQDLPWLNRLTDEDLSERWLRDASERIGYGAVHRSDWRLSDRTDWARTYFYEGLLHFSDPASPLHGVYERNQSQRPTGPPLTTFVSSMRTLHENGLDVRRASLTNPAVWMYGGRSITAKIANLGDTVGRTAAVDIVARTARVLSYEDYARRAANLLAGAQALRWPAANGVELLKSKPLSAVYSAPRTVLQGHYLRQFGDPDMTPQQVGGLLETSPDRHLIALRWGVTRFTRSYVNRACEGLNSHEIIATSRRILDSDAGLILDAATLRAHRRYHASLSPAQKA